MEVFFQLYSELTRRSLYLDLSFFTAIPLWLRLPVRPFFCDVFTHEWNTETLLNIHAANSPPPPVKYAHT